MEKTKTRERTRRNKTTNTTKILSLYILNERVTLPTFVNTVSNFKVSVEKDKSPPCVKNLSFLHEINNWQEKMKTIRRERCLKLLILMQ